MKTLVIAEKPSVGRDIARVLKCTQRGDGYLYNEDYIVSWAIGHLVSLNEPEDYDANFKRWRMNDLPILPENMGLKPIPKTKAQLSLLKKLMNAKDTNMIICATDSGREGELIFRYIYQWADCRKLVKRLWISSLTDAAIADGLSKMRDGKDYDDLYASARCRSEADWLVGMNATRAFTLQQGDLLPMGRVQTPTLAILVTRQKEINIFIPKDYWEVQATFYANPDKTYSGMWVDMAEKGETKIFDQEKAKMIVAKINEQKGVIESVETEEKRQPPPQLFDLTELQRECNQKLHFSAQKTLAIAQTLYEKHKLITYPRTDSRYISQDMVPKLTPTIKALNMGSYQPYATYLLGLPKLPITNRIVNNAKVTDHHAIIPTGAKRQSLTAEEQAVYDRIVRNFLAAFYPAYVYDVTTIITCVCEERFRSKGRVIKNEGWTALYQSDQSSQANNDAQPKRKKASSSPDKDAESETIPLPALTQGEAVTVTESQVLHKKTQPPKPYTEATLLSAMENAGRFVEDESIKEALKTSGLGTPATRAATIEKLISSGYIERKKKNLIPTDKGMRLIEIVPTELRSPETTGKWERGLARIASGEMDAGRFMASIKRYVCYLIECASNRQKQG